MRSRGAACLPVGARVADGRMMEPVAGTYATEEECAERECLAFPLSRQAVWV